MKISEKVTFEHDLMVVTEAHDFNPALHRARQLRDAGKQAIGEKRLIGSVPMKMVELWAKQAGVALNDTDAMQEVMRRNLLSNEHAALRVWEGTY